MADQDFVRNDSSQALINTDITGFEQYKMNRQKVKRQRSLEQRILDLETRLAMVEKLLKERE